MPWTLILIIVAIVLCTLEAFGYSPHVKVRLGWLGIALFMVTFLL